MTYTYYELKKELEKLISKHGKDIAISYFLTVYTGIVPGLIIYFLLKAYQMV